MLSVDTIARHGKAATQLLKALKDARESGLLEALDDPRFRVTYTPVNTPAEILQEFLGQYENFLDEEQGRIDEQAQS